MRLPRGGSQEFIEKTILVKTFQKIFKSAAVISLVTMPIMVETEQGLVALRRSRPERQRPIKERLGLDSSQNVWQRHRKSWQGRLLWLGSSLLRSKPSLLWLGSCLLGSRLSLLILSLPPPSQDDSKTGIGPQELLVQSG